MEEDETLEAPEDEDFVGMMTRVVEENENGLRKLAEEDVAAKRRNERIWNRVKRAVERKLGLRRTEATRISLEEEHP